MYQTLPYGHVEWYRGCGLCTRHYHMVMWSGTEVVDYVPDITIWSCGVVQRLWIMYQTLPYGHVEWYRGCGLCTRHYHMVMWSGTEVVDYVPDILPYGHVEWYRGCGLCTRHITIWSCGMVQRLWIMYQVMWSGTEVVDYVAGITIWSCGVGQRLWMMYQACGVVQRLWIMYQTYYHMVMWNGTEVVDYVPDILPYGHVEWYRGCGLCTRHYHMVMWSGTEVVDYVPDMWSVEWYRGCGLCTRHITIWSCGVVQRLWIMYQTYYHMWSGTEVVDYVPDIYHMVMWSGTEVVDYVPDMWSGTEVVDNVPDILPYGHVEWYRGCGL